MNVHKETYQSFIEEQLDGPPPTITLKEAITFLQSYSALVSAYLAQLKAMKQCNHQLCLRSKIMEKEANLLFEKLLLHLQQFMSETNGVKF